MDFWELGKIKDHDFLFTSFRTLDNWSRGQKHWNKFYHRQDDIDFFYLNSTDIMLEYTFVPLIQCHCNVPFCTFSQEIKILIYIYTLKRVNLFEFFHALNLFGLINFVSYVEDSSCTHKMNYFYILVQRISWIIPCSSFCHRSLVFDA